jgi:hypothetical protein
MMDTIQFCIVAFVALLSLAIIADANMILHNRKRYKECEKQWREIERYESYLEAKEAALQKRIEELRRLGVNV